MLACGLIAQENKMITERNTGTVEKVFKTFSFIFVTHRQRYFMHLSQFDSVCKPRVGEKVTFEVKENPARLNDDRQLDYAVNVRPVENSSEVK